MPEPTCAEPSNRDDARFVNHLAPDHDITWTLDDLISKVIEVGNMLRQHAARHTPAVDIEVQPRIDLIRESAGRTATFAHRLYKLTALFGHRWNAAIRRIDNQGSLAAGFAMLDPISRGIDRDVLFACRGFLCIGLLFSRPEAAGGAL